MPPARATAQARSAPAPPGRPIVPASLVPAPLGVGVAVALLAGVLLVQRFPALPPVLVAVALGAIGIGLWSCPDRRRLAGAVLLGVALASGHGRVALDARLPPELAGRDLTVDARVLGLPAAARGGHGDSVQFDARIEAAEPAAAALVGHRVRLAAYARDGAALPTFPAGSRWRLSVRLRRPSGLVNPGGLDFERRAVELRLAATGYLADAGQAQPLPSAPGVGNWRGVVDAVRERLGRRIDDALPPGHARFVAALALGDTRGLDDRDWEILRATGLTHLIAISGFHVGLVAGFGALLGGAFWRGMPALGRRWPRPQGAAAGALLLAFAYSALAGFALPTVRTLVMIAAALAAQLGRRSPGRAAAFAFALLAVLAVDPLAVLAPGFWLSFAGVGWLLWCLPSAPGQGWVRPFLQAQWVAMLGLLPLTIWFFGQASLAGPLANLVGIPWISLGVVPLCLVGLAATSFSDVVAGTAFGMAARAMDALWVGLERVAAWPQSLAWLPEPSLVALLLALAGIAWCLLPRGVPGRPLAACLLLPLLAPSPDRPAHGEADLWLLDTGQGLSLLVRTAEHDLLYDTGPATPGGADVGASTVVPALRALSVHALDTLVISHGDSDHAGGAAAVVAAFPPGRSLAPPGWAQAPMQPCLAGTRWVRDGVVFTVLHPPRWFPYQRNESSCVLRIDAAGASALLAGDIGRHVEARLARLPPAQIRADVLLVPHHGSASSSSLAFLAAVRPRIGLLAVGRDNRFDLPEPIVLGRYDRYRVAVDSTAASGAVHVRLGADGARVVTRLRQDRRRWWRDAPPGPPGYADGVSAIRR